MTGPLDVDIQDIVFDSRKVKPGALFVAIRGVHHNGHSFVASAVKDGARAVMVDDITLPAELETSSARSPAAFAFYAAQALLGAPVLFSQKRVAELLDPSIRSTKKRSPTRLVEARNADGARRVARSRDA